MSETQPISKIALLAPFEGQYREIGYNALYSARLALTDADANHIDLLAIDDGGSVETANTRIAAISQDPAIHIVIVVGPYATSTFAQQALNNTTMIIVGHWNTSIQADNVLMLSNPDIDALISFDGDITLIGAITDDIVGSELLALEQVPLLIDNLDSLEIYSSGALPSADFREQYLNSAEFVPEPNLLASLTYDATRVALESLQTRTPVAELRHEGLNGIIQFDRDGYWLDAAINHYQYDGELLVNSD